MKEYKGQRLIGKVILSYKIDGVQCIVDNGIARSRAGKPLYNIPVLDDGVYEIYCGEWSKSITACRTHNSNLINVSDIYRIDDKLDPRLYYVTLTNPEPETIDDAMHVALNYGYEGLVLRHSGHMYKVKPKHTYDVIVKDLEEGTGRNIGKLGAFITDMGNVGSGLTDEQRIEFFNKNLIGTYIEVEAMELTDTGKFRHPRFKRLRMDK